MTQALIDYPSYTPAFGLSSGHVQSILPALFRQVSVPFKRSTLALPDDDFLLLDTWQQPDSAAPWVILSHGLEGNSRRPYMQGMARAFYRAGWQVQAWNFRSCGGQMNRLPRFYHSGAIEDLKQVIDHVLTVHQARQIFLLGFSMGGNQTVLTLGDQDLPDAVIGGAAFSVPLDLAGCAYELAKPAQTLYMRRFLKDLKVKIAYKAAQFPELVSLDGYDEIRNFKDFDDRYTAPLHGFRDAQDYWQNCSSGPALKRLAKPTLIVNALNDPFLNASCFDCRLHKRCKNLFFETPISGGHCGFVRWRMNQTFWSEYRALAFAEHWRERSAC